MSVQVENQNNTKAKTADTAQTAANPGAAGFSVPTGKTYVGIRELGGLGNGLAFTKAGAADMSASWFAEMEKMLAAKPELELNLVHLDRQVHGLPMSAILAVSAQEVEGKLKLLTYTLVFENPEVLQPITDTQNGVPVEYKRVASDIWDKQWVDRVASIVQEKFAAAGNAGTFYNAYFATVSIEAVSAVTDAASLHVACNERMFYICNALDVIANELLRKGANPEFNLGNRVNGMRLKSTFGNVSTALVDANLIPIRSDANIVITGSENNGANQNRSLMNGNVDIPLVRTDFYVDIAYNPGVDVNQPVAYGMQMGQQAGVSKLFQGIVNITNVMSLTQKGFRMEYFILGLASTGMLNNHFAWSSPLRPRGGVSGLNLRDISALGYVAGPAMGKAAAPFEGINSAGCSDADFNTLISGLFHTFPQYAIDVIKGGECAWGTSQLTALAEGAGDAYNRALELFVKAADNLFDGNFSKKWDRSKKMFVSSGNWVHHGYYTAATGDRQPQSNYDYLAYLNQYGKNQPELINEYARSFADTSMSTEKRLETRLKPIASQYNTATKDYAHKLFINPLLIQALAECCDAIGLSLSATDLVSFNTNTTNINPALGLFNGGVMNTTAFNSSNGFNGQARGFLGNANRFA